MVLPAPPREPGWRSNPTGLLAMLVVVLTVVGVWWASGGDPGTPTAEPSVAVQEPQSLSDPDAAALSGEIDPETGLVWVTLEELPPEAGDTVELIRAGGPFPYGQDGETFLNREAILPDRESGYYAEYTVETPGSPDRGPRRIVAGDAGELFWSEDHYDSFDRIVS